MQKLCLVLLILPDMPQIVKQSIMAAVCSHGTCSCRLSACLRAGSMALRRERQDAIRIIAAELCDGSDVVEGPRIVELVRTTPVQKPAESAADGPAIALPRQVSALL